LKFRNSCPRYI